MHSPAPHLFYVVDKLLLLIFGVSFATNNDNHIFRVASRLLNGIYGNYGIFIFTVGRIIRSESKRECLLRAYVPFPIRISLGLGNGIIVLLLVGRRSFIRVFRRSVARSRYVIIGIKIKCRSDSDIVTLRRLSAYRPVIVDITHIVVTIGYRSSEPIRPAHTLLVFPYIIITKIFPDGIDLLNVEKKNFFG